LEWRGLFIFQGGASPNPAASTRKRPRPFSRRARWPTALLISRDKAYPSRPSRSQVCTACCPGRGTTPIRRHRAIGPDRTPAPLE